MGYELMITEQAANLLDNLLYYLSTRFGSQSVEHLLKGVSSVYDCLERNPYQFPQCEDYFLNRRGYRKAKVPDMAYVLLFHIEQNKVYVMGVYHELEKYEGKL